MSLTPFEILKIIYQNNLCFESATDFEDAIDVSWDTVNRNYNDEAKLNSYIFRIEQKVNKRVAGFFPIVPKLTLVDFVEKYYNASNLFSGVTAVWDKPTQVRRQQDFCLWMLSKIVGKEEYFDSDKYSLNRESYNNLLSIIFPEGIENEPAIDPFLLSLICFGIISPMRNLDKGRNHSVSPSTYSEKDRNLREFGDKIKELIPLISLMINGDINFIENDESIGKDGVESDFVYSDIIFFLNFFYDISLSCKEEDFEPFLQYPFSGMWCDDKNPGRFWIFIPNTNFLLCFLYEDITTALLIYNYSFITIGGDNFISITEFQNSIGKSLSFIRDHNTLSRFINKSFLAVITSKSTSKDGSIVSFDVEPLIDFRGEQELSIKRFTHLTPSDTLFRKYLKRLESIFIKHDEYSSQFEIASPRGFSVEGFMIGEDLIYSFVYQVDTSFTLTYDKSNDNFDFDFQSTKPIGSLFTVEISEHFPLYAVPKHLKSKSQDSFDRDIIRCLKETTLENDLSLINTNGITSLLSMHAEHGFILPLTEENMQRFGIIKITDRAQLANL